jgi:DNA-directed RNA polymerase specialized sigma24 family protein
MIYRSISDIQLLEMLQSSDQGVFKEIYQRYWRILFLAAQKKLPTDELWEEILQNIFLSLWEKRETLTIQNLRSYLFAALKYQIIDTIRQEIADKKFVGFFAETSPQVTNEGPDSGLDYQDISAIFEKTVGRLPLKTATIFHLSRVENKTAPTKSRLLTLPCIYLLNPVY